MDKNILNIINENDCTGCGACVATCPTKALFMDENIYSELHPYVDSNQCINCGKCIDNCPVVCQNKNEKIGVVYASFRTNAEKRKKSASGGIGATLAEMFILTWKGSFYSTTMSEGYPIVRKCNNLADIENFKVSFYAQSHMNNAYKDIENELKCGNAVLFIGTPCQVAGLKNYITDEYEKLYTVDLLCHGVSPAKYLAEYIGFVCKNNLKRQKHTGVSFRSNLPRCDFVFCLWNGKNIVYRVPSLFSLYFRGFLKGITFRESCYQCKFKSVHRSGDMSIGDFIGLGKHVYYSDDPTRVSIILENTYKGSQLLDLIYKELKIEERSVDEALIEGISLKKSFPRTTKHVRFIQRYPKKGFIKAMLLTDGISFISDIIKVCVWKGLYILKRKK